MLTAFDIETGPLPDDQLPRFDREAVKVGNLKDPEKIEAKRDEAEREWRSKLALSALTGQVLAIGVKFQRDGETQIIAEDSEAETLSKFWMLTVGNYSIFDSPHQKVIGFNSRTFDVPFLIRRSMLVGTDVPLAVCDPKWGPSKCFVDLLDVWRCGDRQLWVKLDTLAQAFGLDGKLEGVSGADFAGLWQSDRDRACDYLRRDVDLTYELALRMGV